ncbi:hypothetical protein MPLB_1870014 [Mesorhizobium sp. ORS 3324]|nr:hypothetical protein MPLB_1870014 [Mesorhizobium sp. ORS 3324]
MSGECVADPAQLELLAKAVHDYCEKHLITGKGDRERVAIEVIGLFGQGMTEPAQLSAALEKGHSQSPGTSAAVAALPGRSSIESAT